MIFGSYLVSISEPPSRTERKRAAQLAAGGARAVAVVSRYVFARRVGNAELCSRWRIELPRWGLPRAVDETAALARLAAAPRQPSQSFPFGTPQVDGCDASADRFHFKRRLRPPTACPAATRSLAMTRSRRRMAVVTAVTRRPGRGRTPLPIFERPQAAGILRTHDPVASSVLQWTLAAAARPRGVQGVCPVTIPGDDSSLQPVAPTSGQPVAQTGAIHCRRYCQPGGNPLPPPHR